MNGLPKPAYIMSEPHLSGWRVVLGYETMAEAQDAHVALSRPTTATGVPAEELALALDRLAVAATVVRRLQHETQGPAFKDAGVSFVAAIDNAKSVLIRHDTALSNPPKGVGDHIGDATEMIGDQP